MGADGKPNGHATKLAPAGIGTDSVEPVVARADSSHEPIRTETALEPLTCDRCGAGGTDLRYLRVSRVIGAIVVTLRRRVEGIFCPPCASRMTWTSVLPTALLGWWAIHGAKWTIPALWYARRSRRYPANINAQALLHHAAALLHRGEFDAAKTVAADALGFAVAMSPRDPELERVIEEVEAQASHGRDLALAVAAPMDDGGGEGGDPPPTDLSSLTIRGNA